MKTAVANFSVIWLRYRKPDWKRPFKTLITIARISLVPLLGLLSCGLMITQFRIDIATLGILVILLGVVTSKFLTRVKK